MTVPAAVLRGLLAGACVALLAAVVAASPQGRVGWWSLVLGTALVAWVVASPASPAPTVLLLLAAVVVLDTGPAGWPLLVVQAACLSGVHLLASLCALVPRGGVWEEAALVPALRRWIVVQGACVPVAVAAAVVSPGSLGTGLEVLAGVVALALVAGVVALAGGVPLGRGRENG